jgi:hypothetical protein
VQFTEQQFNNNNNNNNNNNIFKTHPLCIHGNPTIKPQAYERGNWMEFGDHVP